MKPRLGRGRQCDAIARVEANMRNAGRNVDVDGEGGVPRTGPVTRSAGGGGGRIGLADKGPGGFLEALTVEVRKLGARRTTSQPSTFPTQEPRA